VYLWAVLRTSPSLSRICFLAAGFAAISSLLQADDQPATTDADGYRVIPIVGANGKRTSIRVQTQTPPDAHLSSTDSDGTYRPDSLSLNKTSSLANKTFSSGSLYQNDTAEEFREQSTFLTKPYPLDSGSISNLTSQNFNAPATFPMTNAYNRTASGLDKSYPVNQADASQNKSAQFTIGASDYQNRTANLGTQKVDTYASPLAQKAYNGPEAKLIQRDLNRMSQGLSDVKDLPNRPLTIDEVRDLINHGIKPDADAPPPPASKPLNDPNYTPDPAPPPLEPAPTPPSTPPSPATPASDESDGGMPPPGAMAAEHQAQEAPPENSEPLPK
jgi:hypothetical protein